MNQTCPLDFLTYLIELQILIFMTGELQIRLNGLKPKIPDGHALSYMPVFLNHCSYASVSDGKQWET